MSGDIEYTVLLERRGYKDKPLYRGMNWHVAVGLAEAYIGRGEMVRIEERATTVAQMVEPWGKIRPFGIGFGETEEEMRETFRQMDKDKAKKGRAGK